MSKKENRKDSIEKTYELIEKYVPHGTLDSLEVVKQVEEYRQFWKPEKTNVILLAESHVYTDKQDHEIQCNKFILNKIISNYPTHFVRFVYCLGYGENELLTRKIDRNKMGTWQFWKIFSSCIAEDEMKILKTGTPNLEQRLRNKVNVLRKMQEKGIWLLDASIVGLYRSGIKNRKTIEMIIKTCWENHLKNMIKESDPNHIIIIGKKVENILIHKLLELGFSRKCITKMPQPQGDRGNSQEQLENYRKYQRICAKNCRTTSNVTNHEANLTQTSILDHLY